MDAQLRKDYQLVVEYLHYDGEHYHDITVPQQAAVRLAGNGFGDLASRCDRGGAYPEVLWDWSHVRDSNEDGIRAMAAKIRAILKEGKTQPRTEQCKR